MGAHARPKKSRKSGVMMSAAAVLGMAAPVAVAGVATAAPAAHAADTGEEEAAPAPRSSAPGIHTEHAFLADAGDGSKLWSGSQDETAVPMGSITKVMTAQVITQHHGDALDRMVTVKQEYRDYVQDNGASTADLKTGDQLTVRQLLDAMLVPSGCDAAYALADTFGEGDTIEERVASFVDRMNEEAQRLGMKNTHFDTPSGISLENTNHSTAADLTVLGAEALKDGTISEVVAQKSARQEAPNGRVYTWENTDKLLTTYDGALGIKTGSGPDAAYCLLFAAERDGRTLVGTVLQDSDARFDDAASMLDWGFAQNS